VIVTKDLDARERVKARLERELAAGAVPEARTRVDRFNFGPPAASRCNSASSAPIPEGARHRRSGARRHGAEPKVIVRTSIGASR